MTDEAQGTESPQEPFTRRQRRQMLEATIERLLSAVDALLADLDTRDGDPDLEEQCEDEGAQCDDEGDREYWSVPDYGMDQTAQVRA